MERFPLGPVLDHYGVQYVDSMSGWQMVRCPVHDEAHASCSLNLDARFYDCKACGSRGGALDIIKAREGLEGAPAHDLATQLTGVRYEDLRREPAGFTGRRVSRGQGFQPRYRNSAPARLRPTGRTWT